MSPSRNYPVLPPALAPAVLLPALPQAALLPALLQAVLVPAQAPALCALVLGRAGLPPAPAAAALLPALAAAALVPAFKVALQPMATVTIATAATATATIATAVEGGDTPMVSTSTAAVLTAAITPLAQRNAGACGFVKTNEWGSAGTSTTFWTRDMTQILEDGLKLLALVAAFGLSCGIALGLHALAGKSSGRNPMARNDTPTARADKALETRPRSARLSELPGDAPSRPSRPNFSAVASQNPICTNRCISIYCSM